MRKDTKAKAIPIAVKKAVADRDSIDGWPCCLVCGKPAPPENPILFANAHYISRAQGGLGTTEHNIVTLCPGCHFRYDQTTEREFIRLFLREYLKSKYSEWDEQNLYYRKG